MRRRLEKQLIDEDQSISSRNGLSSISVNQGTSKFGYADDSGGSHMLKPLIASRNQSQPTIRSHSTEQMNTPGRVIRAHQDKRREHVEQSRAFSELVRQAYKPKISKRKVKEMEELKARTNANKPKLGNATSGSKSPSPNRR